MLNKDVTLDGEVTGVDTVTLQAGLRTLHDAGPELKRAISGNLDELMERDPEPMHRVIIFWAKKKASTVFIEFVLFTSRRGIILYLVVFGPTCDEEAGHRQDNDRRSHHH